MGQEATFRGGATTDGGITARNSVNNLTDIVTVRTNGHVFWDIRVDQAEGRGKWYRYVGYVIDGDFFNEAMKKWIEEDEIARITEISRG